MRKIATTAVALLLAAGAAAPAMARDWYENGDHDKHHDNGRQEQKHERDQQGHGAPAAYEHGRQGHGPGYAQQPRGGYGPAPAHMNPYYTHYGWQPGYAPHYHPLPPRPIVYRAPPRPGYWVAGARYYDAGYAPTVVVADYGGYGLLPPPPGYGWRRSPAGDFILVAAATGIIADVLLHH